MSFNLVASLLVAFVAFMSAGYCMGRLHEANSTRRWFAKTLKRSSFLDDEIQADKKKTKS